MTTTEVNVEFNPYPSAFNYLAPSYSDPATRREMPGEADGDYTDHRQRVGMNAGTAVMRESTHPEQMPVGPWTGM